MRICPLCGSNDALMNIPGVVARNTQQSQGTSVSRRDSYIWEDDNLVTTQSQHTQMTDLARALSYPNEQEPGGLRWKAGLFLAAAGGGGLIYDDLDTVVLNLTLIGGSFGASLFLMGYALSKPGPLRGFASTVGTFATLGLGAYVLTNGVLNAHSAVQSIVMVLLLVLGVWGFVRHFQVRRAFRQAAPRRRRAHQIWQGLYYCHRDNVVCDPESGRYAPPGAMEDLLYPG